MLVKNYREEIRKDLDYGKDREKENKELLEAYFGCPLTETHSTCSWDFENESKAIRVELKSRKFNSTRFKDTYITKLKLSKANEYDGDTYFVFEYEDDALYVINSKLCVDCKVEKVVTDLGEKRFNLIIPLNTAERIRSPVPQRCLIVM